MRRLQSIATAGRLGFACLAVLSLVAPAPADDRSSADAPVGLLRTVNGDQIAGKLSASVDEPDLSVAWQHPQFAEPFRFDLAKVYDFAFPTDESDPPARGAFLVELAQGDRLFGSIVDVDSSTVTLDTPAFGKRSIARKTIRRISNWDDGKAVVFTGPGEIGDWGENDSEQVWQQLEGRWQMRGGRLTTDQEGAALFRQIGLPAHARIELELSWADDPNFVLAIGVDRGNSKSSYENAFRIEVWQDQLVLVREWEDMADVASLGPTSHWNGQAKLTIDLDQKSSRMVVSSFQGEELGVIQLQTTAPCPVHPSIRLTNIKGNTSLDFLRVLELAAPADAEPSAGIDVFYLTDGSTRQGTWTGIDGDQWTLKDSQQQESSIAADQLISVNLSSTETGESSDADDTDPPQGSADEKPTDEKPSDEKPTEKGPEVQIATHGGHRLTGVLIQTGKDQVTLEPTSLQNRLSIPVADLRSVSITGAARQNDSKPSSGLPRLETDNGQFYGRLIDTDPASDSGPIRFEPRDATAAAAFLPSFSGRLVYRDPPPPETPAMRQQRLQREAAEKRARQARQRRGGLMNVIVNAFSNQPENRVAAPTPRSVHLRTGEVIPAKVQSIDENVVTFESESTTQTTLPTEKVRVVQLAVGSDPQVDPVDRERLLTVPRIRKKNPPTHLIVATNGDLLRCRLIRLSDETLEVQTRLETIEIPRSVVSKIIWLWEKAPESDDDAEETDPKETEVDEAPQNLADDDASKEPEAAGEGLEVRAVLRGGNRMSLVAEKLSDGVLIGHHPLLGEAKITLADVDELMFGDAPSKTADPPAYSDWKLLDAPEPMLAEDGEGGDNGTGSALVGTQAEDFTLDLLDGGRFRVSEQQGKVLVLDFWATWCGPCLQAMPVIEETVGEFDSDEVRLVAVNLQETAEPIRKTLERLNISPDVALDIDGVAAARYQANAIPQTVVIDRTGKIVRLFVGGGPKLGDNLRQAIEETLSDKPPT
ncbi:TlpA family protein disulfide reductase [Roseiconus nitratireducens]|nr:TlpA disulfide reductase family protein [Roseiconus nitratireducens]